MLTPAERALIDRLAARVAALERARPQGQVVGQFMGGTAVVPQQVGFPARTTGAYDPANGYPWARRRLDVLTPGLTDPGVQDTGNQAFALDGNQTIPSGTDVWLEPSPDGPGLVLQRVDATTLVAVRVLDRVCLATTTTSVDKAGGGTVNAITGFTLTDQYRIEYRPAAWLAGPTYCDTNPADCCPTTIDTTCCEGVGMPATLCFRATLTGESGADGVAYLVYDPANADHGLGPCWKGRVGLWTGDGFPIGVKPCSDGSGGQAQLSVYLRCAGGSFWNIQFWRVQDTAPCLTATLLGDCGPPFSLSGSVSWSAGLGDTCGCEANGSFDWSVSADLSACSGSGSGSGADLSACCLSYLDGRTATLTVPDGLRAGHYTAIVTVSGGVASCTFSPVPGGPGGNDYVIFECSATGVGGPKLGVPSLGTFDAGGADCGGGTGPFSATWTGANAHLGSTGNVVVTA